MTKIILFFVILMSGYGVTVFAAPEISSKIESLIGLDGLTEKIRGGKEIFDGVITDIPTIDEVVDGYETALSGAKDVRETFTEQVDSTKNTIDTIRSGAQKAEETYNDAKDTFDNAKQTLEDVSSKVSQISEVVESVNTISEK